MSAPDLLDRSTFVTRFGGGDLSNRVISRLHHLMVTPRPQTLESCVEWLDDLMGWLFQRGRLPQRRDGETEREARLRLLLEVFEESSAAGERFRAAVALVVERTNATRLFTDTGLPTHHGFGRELVDRFARNVLPEPPVGSDLSRLITRLFSTPPVAAWFLGLSDQVRRRLFAAAGLGGELPALTPALHEAVLLLATRIAMQGTSDEFRRRLPELTTSRSPFLQLLTDAEGLLTRRATLAQVEGTVLHCRALLRRIEASLEEAGISVDMVFQVELLSALLYRFDLVARLSFGGAEVAQAAAAELERDIVEGSQRERSLRALWLSSTRLLARRVVERAGHGGEKYITRTRREQLDMLDAAAGGGALTAVAVATKFFISWAGLPLLFNAVALGLNYSVAFIAMQLSHFTLATKQPAMTAAALAASIEARDRRSATARPPAPAAEAQPSSAGPGLAWGQRQEAEPLADLAPLAEVVARAWRTQFAALLGNVGFVIAIALTVDGLWWVVSGRHVLSAPTAESTIAAHHLFRSGTLLYAALTGVWLWLASLIAGWVENWFVLMELSGAIASHRGLRQAVGPARAAQWAQFALRNISGLGGNLGLGMLLGLTPMLFSMVGIPMEVRHVTFAMGQLVYSVASVGPWSLTRADVVIAIFTVLLVGLINFAVSFALALVVALRARGMGARYGLVLAKEVGRRFLSEPTSFFLAPEDVAPKPPTDIGSSAPQGPPHSAPRPFGAETEP